MKELVYFALGAAVGATMALLFAPGSGKDLRDEIQAMAERELPQMQADLQAAMARTNKRLDKMEADLEQDPQRTAKKEAKSA